MRGYATTTPYNPNVMKRLTRVVWVGLLCLASPHGSPPVHGAAGGTVLGILQAELQRNYQVLKQAAGAGVFHRLHGVTTSAAPASSPPTARCSAATSSGAGLRTVEVRVGDYLLDNTHPIRGDTGAASPRISRVTLPLTDDEKPMQLALWRATDRTFKQASEALTRVKTNVASKIKEEDPAPDFSREEAADPQRQPASYTLDTAQWEARLRRISAPFADDPLVLRSEVSLSVCVRQSLLHQQRRHRRSPPATSRAACSSRR